MMCSGQRFSGCQAQNHLSRDQILHVTNFLVGCDLRVFDWPIQNRVSSQATPMQIFKKNLRRISEFFYNFQENILAFVNAGYKTNFQHPILSLRLYGVSVPVTNPIIED